jgi:biotin transporter BioY
MGWLVSSVLIGVALGLFSNDNDWIIIWMCLVGWMAVLGVISIVTGTAALMESRFMRHQLGQPLDVAAGQVQPLTSNDRAMMNEATTAPILRPQSSVTEHTTTRLIKP